mmetsp:Transcript_24200/g.60049  ORF Transcript_24200/g.60049 Transcript_24200/m.60049 type:complete len:228 (-) Transcript_24200:1080-1763(-)
MSPAAEMSSALISAEPEPSKMRMACPSKASHHVTLRSVPVVTICDSSGWYAQALKNVDANSELLRVKRARSQMMALPSEEALTHSVSFARSAMLFTGPLCSFIDATIVCDCGPTRHTRTLPSFPPDRMREQSFVAMIAVTAECASLMVYSRRPDCGAKARILPSLQPLIMDPPSPKNATQLHSTLGTWMRSSSRASAMCHTRMSELPHVANTSEYPCGNATSLMGSW